MNNTKHAKTRQQILYQNELLKRQYFEYLKDSRRYADNSIEGYERAILIWEDFAHGEDYGVFSKKRAKEFKRWLTERKTKSGTVVSNSYKYQILRKLKDFFTWLGKQDKYRSRYSLTDVDCLNLGIKEAREANNTTRRKPVPTIEQVEKTIENITGKSEIDMRDKALLSLALLIGIRITALVSLPIQSFERDRLVINQDTKLGVKTKYSKSFPTVFFPLQYQKPKQYFLEWFDYLVNEKGFAPTDPIFPATLIKNGITNTSYHSTGEVDKVFWKNTNSARKIFEKRFIAAGVSYYHPHSFRHLIIKELGKLPLTEEQKKAISQNLGHENVTTTFGSYGYGHIDEEKQIDLVAAIDWKDTRTQKVYQVTEEELQRLLEKTRR